MPLIIRYPGKVPAGKRVRGYNQHKDLVPTLLELAEIEPGIAFDGSSLLPMVRGEVASHEQRVLHHRVHLDAQARLAHPAVETDRGPGARLPLQAAGRAVQPGRGPAGEQQPGRNLTRTWWRCCKGRMEAWIAKREQETGLPNPIYNQGDWHGHEGVGSFKSSQQAYDTLHIGDPKPGRQAASLKRRKIKSVDSHRTEMIDIGAINDSAM